jgi:TolA-binding protein
MTELERMLKDTLAHMEQDLSATLMTQGKTLDEQQRTLTAQREAMSRQQEQIREMNSNLQELTRRLHDLSNAYKSLEPLLPRLNSLLSGSRAGAGAESGAGNEDVTFCHPCLSPFFTILYRQSMI